MGSILFLLLILFVFIAFPLLLPRFIVWLTESRTRSDASVPPATSQLQTARETVFVKEIGLDLDPPVSGDVDTALLISTLRFVEILIFLVGWPFLTYILPFTFDDPTSEGTFGRILFFGLYVLYPAAFYFSDAPYKSFFQKGHKVKAVAIACTPLFILLLFFVLPACLKGVF